MNLSNLKPASGSVKGQGKRLGRGQGSGKGGTAARGHKGAKSRSGYSRKIGFEGTFVDAGKISEVVDFDALVGARLARKNELVKILGRGELKAKLKVSAHKFTATAKAAIEAAGGEAITL